MKPMKRVRCCLSILVCFVVVQHVAEASTPATNKALAARVKRDAARCRAHAGLDVCDDAIRWSPSDPTLLVAYGDALLRTGRAPDALRQYQRAATLAPLQPGLKAKIAATEKTVHARRRSLARHAPLRSTPAADESSKTASIGGAAKGDHYSNAAPESQSH